MSALPPKADMCGATAYVCFGPIADIFSPFGSRRPVGRVQLVDPRSLLNDDLI